MPNPNEGGSANPGDEVLFSASFPTDGGGTVNNEIPIGEKPVVPDSSAPVAPENAPAAAPANPEPGKNNQPDGSQPVEPPALSTEEQKLHNQQLDFIEDIMKQGDDTARKFFNEHPEYAVIANRSKRLKEAYRGLIEGEQIPSTPTTPNSVTPAGKTPAVPPENAIENIDAIADKIYMKNLSREQATMQKMQAETFAVAKGINRDSFDTLLESAKALEAATGQPFSECLEGASRTINGKASVKAPTIPSGGSSTPNGAQAVPEKESEITRYMGLGYDRPTAEKYYNSKYGASETKPQFSGKLGETFRT